MLSSAHKHLTGNGRNGSEAAYSEETRKLIDTEVHVVKLVVNALDVCVCVCVCVCVYVCIYIACMLAFVLECVAEREKETKDSKGGFLFFMPCPFLTPSHMHAHTHHKHKHITHQDAWFSEVC